MSDIYLAITVDTECDKGPHWRIQRPLQFSAVTECIPQRLNPIFARYQARATYLVSPEVMQSEKCIKELRQVMRQGHELGTHLHGEFLEPHPTCGFDTTWEMQNTYSREIEFGKLRSLTQLFIQAFGYHPKSFRAGRFGISNHTLSILHELDYKVDSSVAPNMSWKDRGGAVEFFGYPEQPYHPSRMDLSRPGDLPILEVPVTTGLSWADCLPHAVSRTRRTLPVLWSIPLRLFKNQFQTTMLRPTFKTGTIENMRKLIESKLKRNLEGLYFFVMMFHNVDFMPGCSPYALNEADSNGFQTRLDRILDYFRSLETRFIVLNEIPGVFHTDASKELSN